MDLTIKFIYFSILDVLCYRFIYCRSISVNHIMQSVSKVFTVDLAVTDYHVTPQEHQ